MAEVSKSCKKTVDIQHAHNLEELRTNQRRNQELREDLCAADESLSAYANITKSSMSDEQLTELLDLQDRRAQLRSQIDVLSPQEEIDYLLNAGTILFRYYDLVEKGQPRVVNVQPPGNSILKYFSLKAVDDDNNHIGSGKGGASARSKSKISNTRSGGGGPPKLSAATEDNRATLLEQYLGVMDPTYVVKEDPSEEDKINKCGHCGSVDRTMRVLDGYIECNTCHDIENILVDHDKPSYKEPPKEVSYFAYKRMNHLNEHLSQSQGRESTTIDDHVIDQILMELKKQKINNMVDVTASKVKEILKKLKINKYYEHTPHILSRLTGKPIQHLSPELEEQLRSMFKMIQYPFLVHAPPTRKNFLSYSYCINKFLQLLGHDEFLASFPLLKSRDKLAQQDAIWQKICNDLDWEFVPSL